MAPNAPIGATHMIMASTLNTTFWKTAMPRRAASPVAPSACTAKPISSATNSVDSTDSPTSGETSVVGMMLVTKPVRPPSPSPPAGALYVVWMSRPCPGWMRLPTTRPIARAKVDMTMK